MPLPDPGIYILTGPVGSGKTSSLLQWTQREKATGILTPVVNGQRSFRNVQTGEMFPMEAGEAESGVLHIGRFRFSKEGFEKAIQVIRQAITQQDWLVIDEIGPLELKAEGFHDVLQEAVKKRQDKILLVVREGLVREVQEHFGFAGIVITNMDHL